MNEYTLLAALIVLVGSFVQSATGFGLAIVTAPLLLLLSADYIPAPITVVALVLSIINVLYYRHSLELRGLMYALIGRIPGSICGGFLLLWLSPSTLSLFIGILVLVAVMISLFPVKIEPTNGRMTVAGFLSGVFGTSSSIGGPPLALLLQHQAANSIRANLSAFFVVSSIISLIVQWQVERFTWHHFYLSLPLLPAAVIGFWLSIKVAHKINKPALRFMSLSLCTISGSYAIFRYAFM